MAGINNREHSKHKPIDNMIRMEKSRMMPKEENNRTENPIITDRATTTVMAKNSIRVETPNAATASGPYEAMSLVITPIERGIIIRVPAAGTPMKRMLFHELKTTLSDGNSRVSILSR